MKFIIEWFNGSEVVNGKTYQEACRKIKMSPTKIITGFLVRVKTPLGRWRYWDAEQFWKCLKGEKLK